jgi:predicted ATP-dependent endonuclease of OLD family
MSMSFDDIMREEAILELHGEAVMKAVTLAQCIYLFVEGESEENAFPILLERCGCDLEKLGIVIANYNGIGNLKHILRLLSKTLSHDRPIVVTSDNDDEGKKMPSVISDLYTNKELVTFVSIPNGQIVKYSSGYWGGSFEESFDSNVFLTACFTKGIINNDLVNLKSEFEDNFDVTKPWYSQIIKFHKDNNISDFVVNKVKLAVELAESCTTVPETYKYLAEVLINVRNKHPVKHPDDVDIPKIPGLTC